MLNCQNPNLTQRLKMKKVEFNIKMTFTPLLVNHNKFHTKPSPCQGRIWGLNPLKAIRTGQFHLPALKTTVQTSLGAVVH